MCRSQKGCATAAVPSLSRKSPLEATLMWRRSIKHLKHRAWRHVRAPPPCSCRPTISGEVARARWVPCAAASHRLVSSRAGEVVVLRRFGVRWARWTGSQLFRWRTASGILLKWFRRLLPPPPLCRPRPRHRRYRRHRRHRCHRRHRRCRRAAGRNERGRGMRWASEGTGWGRGRGDGSDESWSRPGEAPHHRSCRPCRRCQRRRSSGSGTVSAKEAPQWGLRRLHVHPRPQPHPLLRRIPLPLRHLHLRLHLRRLILRMALA